MEKRQSVWRKLLCKKYQGSQLEASSTSVGVLPQATPLFINYHNMKFKLYHFMCARLDTVPASPSTEEIKTDVLNSPQVSGLPGPYN